MDRNPNLNTISHVGVVQSVDSRRTVVEIVSTSACAACHAKGLCTASEAAKKEVVVPTDPSVAYSVGEEVDVVLAESLGLKAVLISYVVPLSILLILVVSLSYTNLHEVLAGLIGVAAAGIYYLILYLRRDAISKEYSFQLRKRLS